MGLAAARLSLGARLLRGARLVYREHLRRPASVCRLHRTGADRFPARLGFPRLALFAIPYAQATAARHAAISLESAPWQDRLLPRAQPGGHGDAGGDAVAARDLH